MEDASLIGITLAGKFRITSVIGEGGMATVYRAQQDAEPNDVAIKVMNPDLAKDARFVRRFRREAKAASMLKHPNTVSILEFGVDQGYVFLAMECLEGHDLALLLHRERRITELRAVHILIQVCKALSAAHEMSIVHRDLKPDNIMLVKQPKGSALPLPNMSPNDFVKVLDFGIAKILDEDDKGTSDPRAEPITAAKSMLTRVGTIVGTPAYMAPEQGRAESVDGRTDVYACGVLLYELITGRVPFSGETPMQVVMRHVNEPPDPPSKFIPVEPNLERVILKSLAKWPAQRQQSAADLAAELTALIPGLGTEKRQPGESVGASSSVIISAGAGAPAAPRPAAGAPAAAAPSAAAGPPPTRPVAAPQPPAPPQAAPQAPPPTRPAQAPQPQPIAKKPHNPLEGSTLVMEPGPPPNAGPPKPAAPVASQKPPTTQAPAFPTLNIDVPPDLLADIDAKLAAGSAAAGAAKPGAAPLPAPHAVEPPIDSDDDVRTLVARDVPPRASMPNIPPFGEDDPRTMLASGQGRGASIPDLSQPLGAPLPGGVAPPNVAPPNAAPQNAAASQDKSTTLVSALPNEKAPSASLNNPAPSTLKALKGTAKSDPVDIQVGSASPSPTTKPSPGSIGLDQTQALDPSQTMASPAPSPAPKVDERKSTPPKDDAPPPSAKVLPVAVAEPVVDKPVTATPEPAVVVWKPKRRRLNGPIAMMVGILIGALLFAIVFAAIFLIKPQ